LDFRWGREGNGGIGRWDDWGFMSFKNEKSDLKSPISLIVWIKTGKNNGSTKILARILIAVDDGNPPH
jgi:hypothetical protein